METKNPINIKRGKKSKAQGGVFELRTRKDLEEKGWICSKWGNQVEFEKQYPVINEQESIGKLIPAKPKMVFNPIIKRMVPQQLLSGFPDFICFRTDSIYHGLYEVIGVESKMGKYLDQEEKLKCRWYLKNNIFSHILIAFKTKEKNRVKVNYIDFEEYDKK